MKWQGAGCWDQTMVPTVSETKSFNDRLNRPSRQTAGVPPFRSSFLPQFLYVAFGLRLSFRRVSFRQQTYSGKHAYLNFADEEVLTVSLFGLVRKRETIKEIHEYAEDYFSEG